MASRFSSAHPHELDQSTVQLMWLIHGNLPDPPASTTARLRTLRAAPSDGVDRISCLPDALIRDIVSRLPAKDAARTAVLAARWRGIWRSTPLVLVDNHLLPNRARASSSPNEVTTAVSLLLAAHPGPFRCVHLTRGRMGAHPAHLRLWLRLLAARGVQELVLVNRPSPIDVRLPSTLFTISTLTRLYIGVWKFPDAAGLQGASFPNLRELGICSVAVESGGIDAVVARSPALEILNIQGIMKGVRLRLVSHSLRCVQICAFVLESVEVVNAPRLVLSQCLSPAGGSCTRVKIGNVPKLSLFGYLEPGKYALEIQDTVIVAGIKTSASMTVTSVRTLSLKVRFRVHSEVKMVIDFLRCFPNVETLHIVSEKCDPATAKLNLKVWKEAGPIASVILCLKAITFCEYRARQDELAFLQYIFHNALVLKYAMVRTVNPMFTSLSLADMIFTLENMSDEKWPSKLLFVTCTTNDPEGGRPWIFRRGANFSDDDPFAPIAVDLKAAGRKTRKQRSQAGKPRN